MTESVERLVQALKKLPSIGEKSAWRMALHLLEQDEQISFELAEALVQAKQRVHKCTRCFTWSEEELCQVCSADNRDSHTLCVVERPRDMWILEKSGRFRGLYHVLGGVLSPMNGITSDKLTLDELRYRIDSESITEVIIGLGGSSEAETTAHYVSRILEGSSVTVSRFARGLAAGMDLEYADRFTLDQALNERKIISRGGKF